MEKARRGGSKLNWKSGRDQVVATRSKKSIVAVNRLAWTLL